MCVHLRASVSVALMDALCIVWGEVRVAGSERSDTVLLSPSGRGAILQNN